MEGSSQSLLQFLRDYVQTSSMAPSVEMLCRCLCCLEDVCRSLQEPLQVKSTAHYYKNWVDGELDESLILLDVIGLTRDAMVQMKYHLSVIQSALRRRLGREADFGKKIGAYQSFKKNMKKQFAKHIKDLKKKAAESPHSTSATIALREATSLTISFLESLFSFMLISRPALIRRNSLVPKWVGRGRVACEVGEETVNEVAKAENCLSSLFQGHKIPEHKSLEEANYAQKQLLALELSITPIQERLDCLFNCLMKTRVSLLNSLSY